MMRKLKRILLLRISLIALMLCPAAVGWAEKPADLPMPTSYVNDFAHVLSPGGQQQIEDLCKEVHDKANAELVVVTVKTLDGGQSVEEFTVQLEEKWKLGKKGEDRSALFVIALDPHALRIETGYGLEGMLNDAKVGAILDGVVPFAKAGDYDQAALTGVQGLADVVAADAHVTLTGTVHQYHRQAAPAGAAGGLGIGQIVLGVGFIALFLILIATGHIGWAWVLLSTLMGGGGGGGRDDEGGGGGGFGGSGGGSSGGGGASRGY